MSISREALVQVFEFQTEAGTHIVSIYHEQGSGLRVVAERQEGYEWRLLTGDELKELLAKLRLTHPERGRWEGR